MQPSQMIVAQRPESDEGRPKNLRKEKVVQFLIVTDEIKITILLTNK